VLAQTHGDSECLAAQGGTDCLLQDAGPHFAHILDAPLWVNAEVNDVRAAGSPPLDWYFEVAGRVAPATREQPLGLLSFGNPYPFDMSDRYQVEHPPPRTAPPLLPAITIITNKVPCRGVWTRVTLDYVWRPLLSPMLALTEAGRDPPVEQDLLRRGRRALGPGPPGAVKRP
jgi:hypothetical protein